MDGEAPHNRHEAASLIQAKGAEHATAAQKHFLLHKNPDVAVAEHLTAGELEEMSRVEAAALLDE